MIIVFYPAFRYDYKEEKKSNTEESSAYEEKICWCRINDKPAYKLAADQT